MNDWFYQNLGRKIREQRKGRKLTQQALCGSDLNRSMLSQIENGIARPSIDTLLLLCRKLGIPLSYLMCESKKEEAQYKRMQTIEEIRNLYGSGQYRKCTVLCRAELEEDDEIAYILSQCEVMLAGECLQRSALSSAEGHITAAEIAVQDTSYGQAEVRNRCKFFRMLIHAVQNQQIPPVDTILRYAAFADSSFVLYLTLLSYMEEGTNSIPASLATQQHQEAYRNYLSARIQISQERYADAYPLLRSVCQHPPGFFTEFFALRDMEYCCQKNENYKEAYEFAKKRLSLVTRYEK